jgi:hypothetical protein
MTDILERLRAQARYAETGVGPPNLPVVRTSEAVAEIERLRTKYNELVALVRACERHLRGEIYDSYVVDELMSAVSGRPENE